MRERLPQGPQPRQGDCRDQEIARGAGGLKTEGLAPAGDAARRVHPLIRHAPDPDHPGWWTWDLAQGDRFNAAIGKLLVRAEGAGRATCRMFPEHAHSNLGDMVHGGALMTFVDMAFFAGGRLAGADVMRAVTLDCSVQFLKPARLGVPLDAEVELLRETKRLAFLRGRVVQAGELVAAFSGTLRKFEKKDAPLGDG